jgi:hypothetical protein
MRSNHRRTLSARSGRDAPRPEREARRRLPNERVGAARAHRELAPRPALGYVGRVPPTRGRGADDVRPDDGRELDLHRHPGNPAGHYQTWRLRGLALGSVARTLTAGRWNGRRSAARSTMCSAPCDRGRPTRRAVSPTTSTNWTRSTTRGARRARRRRARPSARGECRRQCELAHAGAAWTLTDQTCSTRCRLRAGLDLTEAATARAATGGIVER